MSLAERLDEWKEDFKREGLVEGEARIVLRLLQKRFGELPDSVRARLEHAGPEQLEWWTERLLEVESLDALFDSVEPAVARKVDP
jgi:hypothetical protein